MPFSSDCTITSMSRRRSSTPSASAATSTSVGRPRPRIVEGDLLHDGVHRAALGRAEPAAAPTRPIVGPRLLAVARIAGLAVVGVGLATTDRCAEPFAGRDCVVVRLVVVEANNEPCTKLTSELGPARSPSALAMPLGVQIRRT